MYDFSDLTVIIPTLNEAENVPKLLSLLIRKYNGIKIIVSDDGSTDGTKENVVRLARRRPKQVMFLDRRRSRVHGLTASVLEAVLITKTEKIIVMDGDMQHPFEKVGNIARALDANDLVIGVRTSVKYWGIGRRLVSVCMRSFVYVVFKIRGKPTCSDMMSGFFGIRAHIFKSLIRKNRNSFVGNGYKVLLDVLRLINRKASIADVPYSTFHDRKYGKSKTTILGMNQSINTLKSALS